MLVVVAIVIAAIFLAVIGALVAWIVVLSVLFSSYLNAEPRFSAPIEWQSTADSDDRRSAEAPVLVRLDPDGSAWVESFPITPRSSVSWITGGCYDNRDGQTYSGPATWALGSGGGVDIEIMGSATAINAGAFLLREDWTAPSIFSCIDGSVDIDLELLCGDPGNGEPEDWVRCQPSRE